MSLFTRRQTLLALAVLLGLTLLFFRQVVFAGMVYNAPDIQASGGATTPLAEALQEGTYPLWNPYIFSGMPSYASLMSAPLVTPSGWLHWLLNLPFAVPRRLDLVFHFFFAGLGVFIYLRWRGTGIAPALLGGLAFEFTTHLVGMVAFGHNTKLATVAYLPWGLWAAERLLARPTAGRLAALALLLGLQLLEAHVQMAYYTWLAVGLCALYWLVRTLLRLRFTSYASRFTRHASRLTFHASRLAYLLAALLLALSLSAVLNLPVANYARYSVRGGAAGLVVERAGQWSLPPWELLTFLLPRLFGFGGATYWGGLTFADFSHYGGCVTLALAVLAVARGSVKRSASKMSPDEAGRPASAGFSCFEVFSGDMVSVSGKGEWDTAAPPIVPFLALLVFVSAVLACGSYLLPLFRSLRMLLPLYNVFRAPVQALVLAEFALAALAGLGLQALLDSSPPYAPRWLLIGTGALVVLAMLATLLHSPLFALLRPLYPDAYAPDVQQTIDTARFSMLLRDLWALAFLLGCAAVFAWGFLGRRIGAGVCAALMVLLVVVDLWMLDGPLNRPQPPAAVEEAIEAGELAQFFHADPALFRVFPAGAFFADNRWPAHRVFTIGGYSAAKLRVYQGFLDAFGLPDRVNLRALALLNVKYVLAPQPLDVVELEPIGWTVLAYDGQPVQVYLYRYAEALPRAWLVGEYRLVENSAAALAAVQADGFDPAQAVVLLERPPLEPCPGNIGSVEVLDYRLHEIDLRVQADTPRLLVLSEVFYPQGWRAMVDGVETPILQADYVLRAVTVPAGEHRVTLRFEPWDVRAGLAISIVAAVVIVSTFGWSLKSKRGAIRGCGDKETRGSAFPCSPLSLSPCHAFVRVPECLDELVVHQPLPHLLWRIGEWEALSRCELQPPILDLGCGDGWFGRMLYRDQAVCGMDWVKRDVCRASRLGVYRHAVVADAVRLPFADGTWATVVANSTMEHVRDLDAALREVRRVLRPGGRLYATLPDAQMTSFLFYSRGLGARYGGWLNRRLEHFHCADAETWRARLTQAGLELVSAQALLPRRAVLLWDALLPFQYVLRRVHRVLPWYRWLRRPRRAILTRWLARLEMQPGEGGAVWLLEAR